MTWDINPRPLILVVHVNTSSYLASLASGSYVNVIM